MARFSGSDFVIQLPTGCSDESTYAFAFPSREEVRPSLVVKTERLARPVCLAEYVGQQLESLRGALQNFIVVSSGPVEGIEFSAHDSVFDWGDATRRVRQKQRYILLEGPLRVVTLTATSLRDNFAQSEALFDAIFLSFKPING